MSTQPVTALATADVAALGLNTDPRSHLTLQRGPQTTFATYGALRDLAGPLCVTLEKPGGGNVHDVNCIPAGTYPLSYRHSPRFGDDRWHIDDVPGRDGILIHNGCLPRDTDGCCLVGTERGHVDYADGKPGASGDGITQSKAAYARFLAHMAGLTRSTITILDPPAP